MRFFDASAAANYAAGTPLKVPGFADLHKMAAQLMAERVPENARILVLGAGGGLEIQAFADAHAGWAFDGIDPSTDMLELARQITAAHASRVALHEGYIDNAPHGPFDAATCFLTMHFVPHGQRLETLMQIHRRLKPGAPFIMAHISFPQEEPERTQWMQRHLAYGGTPQPRIESAVEAMTTRLTILAPDEEEKLLREAGFTGACLFYAGLSFKGWVAYA